MINIEKPTLLLNTERAMKNISRMAEKARQQGVHFRPHFKTHQSAIIGEWFREVGVTATTVSSVDMALYFAHHGWDDITIAFPVNVRQADALNILAQSIRLGVLVESRRAVEILRERLAAPVDVWIEIDEGSHRTGISWDRPEDVLRVAKSLQSAAPFRLRGLLTHAGRIYRASKTDEIVQVYGETVSRMNNVRQVLLEHGFPSIEVSVGDTPGCTLSPDLGQVDEIRPGNFVFYDVQQLRAGVCTTQDIAVAVACPVVAKYPERQELVLYGGAIHLSKDTVEEGERRFYGLVTFLTEGGWGLPIPGAYVSRLSQEHGVVYLPEPYLDQVEVGDVLCVIPAHSCLTVNALGEYLTLDGKIIPTMVGGSSLCSS